MTVWVASDFSCAALALLNVGGYPSLKHNDKQPGLEVWHGLVSQDSGALRAIKNLHDL